MKNQNLFVRVGIATGVLRQDSTTTSPVAAAVRPQSAPNTPRAAGVTAPRPTQPPAQASMPQQPAADQVPAVRPDLLPARSIENGINTIFPAAAIFSGDLEISEPMVIKGIFMGNITQTGVHSLIVGATGGVHGNVKCFRLVVAGTIEGDVQANEVVVLETGKIMGDVKYERLAVEAGGQLDGLTKVSVFNVVAEQAAVEQTTAIAADGASTNSEKGYSAQYGGYAPDQVPLQ